MIEIDGAQGEGGGQVVRSALTLSLLTGKPFEIVHIRAKRKKPGLKAQHLAAVAVAAAVGGARVTGARVGSDRLVFAPSVLRGGDYRYDIGTAGSISLVLQSLLLPLVYADSPARFVLRGGTHVAWSPCYHYLELHWLPYMRQIGMHASLSLRRAGFYPRGGGEVVAEVEPTRSLAPLVLLERGRLVRIFCLSAVAKLNIGIAERQRQRTLVRLAILPVQVRSVVVQLHGLGPGSMLLLLAEFEQGRCCFFSLGQRGKPAERVADESVDALVAFLDGKAAVDPFLADQLLLPLALAEGTSLLHTSKVSMHLCTNITVLSRFLPVKVEVEEDSDGSGILRIEGAGGWLPPVAGRPV